eukprot:TRINITY_DN360_c0_g1_i1.p1 TRINITY_DN360_c0_g1~~TRINITY_DN360_c0_g1_i1.p1  ORF type:complete len:298 (-),score=41.71 TRINITY_DN360_c0_g1_i1:32-925(-)
MERPGWLVCSNPNCKAKKGFREDLSRGDIVCTSCGRVAMEKTIDMGSEWRNFSDSGENKSRAENVDDVVDKLSTQITVTSKGDGKHNALSRLQQQFAGNEQKALTQAVSKINEFAELMELKEDVRKRAKSIYKQFETKKQRKIRGSNSDAIIVAVLYLACKELNVSRTFKELAKDTGTKEQEIKKMYLVLAKQLGGSTRAAPVAPHELVIRICSNLQLPPIIKSMGEQIAKNVASRLEGKSPSSIAAASIYMAVKIKNLGTNEKEIAKAASISASTVKNIFKEMEPYADEIVPKISD